MIDKEKIENTDIKSKDEEKEDSIWDEGNKCITGITSITNEMLKEALERRKMRLGLDMCKNVIKKKKK